MLASQKKKEMDKYQNKNHTEKENWMDKKSSDSSVTKEMQIKQ